VWQLSRFPEDDVLSEILRSIRVRSTMYCQSEFTAPWGFRVEAREIASFHLVVAGSCWVDVDGIDRPLRLAAGDLVVLFNGQPHQLRDTTSSPVTRLEDILATHPVSDGLRLSHGGGGSRTDLLCGGFVVEAGEAHLLRAAIPPVVYVRGQDSRPVPWLDAILTLLNDELASRSPGAETVVARLSDVLLAKVLGACLAGQDQAPITPALKDPQIATALRLIHDRPEASWTVAGLASRVAMSRSAFAARFRRLTGESPMRYLRRFRLNRAAEYLSGSGKNLVEIARLTGYESDVALSKAFRRHFGAPPGTYRTRSLPTGAAPVVG
jgi:AraC-like DNA-binding protein